MNTPTEYTCDKCGGTFRSPRTNEEAKREMKENFALDPDRIPVAIVCESCYREFMKKFNRIKNNQ